MIDDSGFSDFHYSSADGLRLHARIYGKADPQAMPVVCLPGLTRNAKDFHQLAMYLSEFAATRHRVISFDYRGRGLSDYDPDWKKYDVGIEAGDILTGLDALGIPSAAFIGTSRGGLILHILTMLRPDMLKAVVLNDIGPVLEVAGLALIKSYLDAPAAKPASFEEAARIQKSVHGLAFPALGDRDWLDMAHAVYREVDGEIRPDFDPALLHGLDSFDLSQPIPTLWPQFDAMSAIPVMVIRGENSLLLSPQTVEEMRQRHPMLEAVTVAGQGHAPFLHTDGLAERISAFIDAAQ
ncbi:MAG: alpha/beta hydrolase [Rhizobiaceae bacterium]|nr:alpha/beta hydrolase [Rhizobiaceae bacterium]